MKKWSLLLIFGLWIIAGTASAHCMKNKYYVGAGLGMNSSQEFGDASGYQLFAGYCLDFNFKSPRSKTSVEVGYMDSGDFEEEQNRFGNNPNRTGTVTVRETYSGLWFAGLAEYKFDSQMHIMARAGLDVGDQTGIMFGGGAGYNVTKYAQIRAEYILHDEVDSFQVNWISEF
ncbi:MAG: hypothetical protein PVG89_05735 [Gammaproteobacteria bacterium]|jgi:hypothetical protein